MRIGQVRDRPKADAIEIGIEEKASPAELEPHALGEEVVGVEMHALEEEILDQKKREERDIERDAGRGIIRKRQAVMHRERIEVEAQHGRADQIEPHLRVDASTQPLRVLGAAEK